MGGRSSKNGGSAAAVAPTKPEDIDPSEKLDAQVLWKDRKTTNSYWSYCYSINLLVFFVLGFMVIGTSKPLYLYTEGEGLKFSPDYAEDFKACCGEGNYNADNYMYYASCGSAPLSPDDSSRRSLSHASAASFPGKCLAEKKSE
jgi:hypothetical protein